MDSPHKRGILHKYVPYHVVIIFRSETGSFALCSPQMVSKNKDLSPRNIILPDLCFRKFTDEHPVQQTLPGSFTSSFNRVINPYWHSHFAPSSSAFYNKLIFPKETNIRNHSWDREFFKLLFRKLLTNSPSCHERLSILPTWRYIMSVSDSRLNDKTISVSVCICMELNHLMTVPYIIQNGSRRQNVLIFG